MKKIMFTILAGLTIDGYAMSCSLAKSNMLNTTTEIKANHQGLESFSLDSQGELLDKDDKIMAKYNYTQSINYYMQNCRPLQ